MVLRQQSLFLATAQALHLTLQFLVVLLPRSQLQHQAQATQEQLLHLHQVPQPQQQSFHQKVDMVLTQLKNLVASTSC
jgi:hypothetical protein